MMSINVMNFRKPEGEVWLISDYGLAKISGQKTFYPSESELELMTLL